MRSQYILCNLQKNVKQIITSHLILAKKPHLSYNTIMKQHNDILIPDWADNIHVVCGFTTPKFGNQALTRKCRTGTLADNRTQLCQNIGTDPNRIYAPHQIHGRNVLTADETNLGHGSFGLENADDGDACITNQNNITLITTWADCIPIILYDTVTHTAAAVHSGWRGTAQNVVAATVAAMQSNPAEIYASVGPGIRDCCYEVGDEVAETFLAMNEQISQYVTKKDGRYRLDLQSVVYTQLIQCGILPKHIDRCTFCTGCHTDPSFFSCRKDGKDVFEGQAAFICMK